jgi:hypothetical protein
LAVVASAFFPDSARRALFADFADFSSASARARSAFDSSSFADFKRFLAVRKASLASLRLRLAACESRFAARTADSASATRLRTWLIALAGWDGAERFGFFMRKWVLEGAQALSIGRFGPGPE